MNEVTLYIPCFNAAKTICFSLEAVFKQTYPLKEVVVIDDCSTDETAEIASHYSVRIIRHMSNRGLAAARNTAVRNINTEFIASVDADCLPNSDWLEQLMKKFVSSKIAGVGGKLLETYSSSVFDLWRSVHMKQYWEDEKTNPPFLFGSNTVFRKETLINIGLYGEVYKNNYEDVDICNRLKKKGCVLIYEPKAIAHHLRDDSIYSILNSYWKWNLAYYQKKRYYSNPKSFVSEVKDNLGLVNRYIEEDITFGRYQLLYLDFLLVLHHSLKDFECFISQNNQKSLDISGSSLLPFWLALLDLTFFYHFSSKKKNLSTLMPRSNAFLQNFFALNLILGKFIQEKFRSRNFQKILYKHLFLSIYKINDTYLSDTLLNLLELYQDWGGLFKKKQPNLNILFLENLFLNFQEWLRILIDRHPEIIQMIEISAEKTDSLSLFRKEECNDEDK
jgi:glycosyltransferase involved in cell wall biosynthesis